MPHLCSGLASLSTQGCGKKWGKAPPQASSDPCCSPQPTSYVSNAWRSICFFWGVRRVGNWISKKMKRSPFLVGSSGNGIPSPGTFLQYLGLREDERGELRGHLRAASEQSPCPPCSHHLRHGAVPTASTLGSSFLQPELGGRRGGWLVPDSLLPENPLILSLWEYFGNLILEMGNK